MSTPTLRKVAVLLILLGALVWFLGLVGLLVWREPHGRQAVGIGGLCVAAGCCLWHVARFRGGAR